MSATVAPPTPTSRSGCTARRPPFTILCGGGCWRGARPRGRGGGGVPGAPADRASGEDGGSGEQPPGADPGSAARLRLEDMSDVDLLLLWLGCPLWLPLVVVLVMLVRKLPAHPGQGNTMIQQDEQE